MRSNFPYMMYRVRWTNLCGLVSKANIVANKIDLISCNGRGSLMIVEHIETEYNSRWKREKQSAYGGVLCSRACGWSIGGGGVGSMEMRTWDDTMTGQIIRHTSSIRILDNYIGHRTRCVNIDFSVGFIRMHDATARAAFKNRFTQ